MPRSTDVRTAQNTLRRTSLPPPSRDSFSGSTMTANALSGRPSFDYIEDMPPRYSPIGTGRRQSYAASSTVELVPLKPLGEVWDDQPPSPTSTLIPLPTGQNLRTSHRAVPAKTVFAPTAPPLHLPKLDEHLSGMSAPSFSSYPKREPVGPGSGKGKSKAGSSADVFPPMDMLAQTKLSIDDLEHNAVVPPSWRDRNTIFGGLVSAFLGITGSSAIAKHYSLQGVYNTVQMFALVLGAAVPAETITEGWRKIFLGTIPNVLALNFGSTMVQSLIFLVVFLVIACLLLYAFHKSTSRLATTATREGLQPQYDGSGWGVVITSFVLTILYLPLSTIALHALVWSSDFWVVPNPYLNSTVSPAQLPSLGPAEVYRQPLDFCYTTTMLKDQINYAPVIVLISAFTFIMMTFWFPVRLARAVKLAVPHVDPYTELGKKRTPDEMESEYMRLMDRDISPFAFLYNDFRRKWASYKSIYLWAKLSTLLIVAVLDPDNCIFRNADRNAVNVARQSVLVVAMLVFFLVQCFLAPFIDPVSNASEWISRLNYLSTSTVGLFVALNVPGSSILNGPILYVIYIVTYGLSIYFSIINFSFIRRWVKRVTQRIDFSIDIFSPHIDISSTSPHVRRRIWQESVSVLLLTAPECKIPLSQKMSFVIHREHEWPPYLLDFHNTPAERHVENLKILREVGWPTYLNGIALHTAPQATRFRELERAILRQFIGPDAHWCNPAVPPVPGQMSYFGSAWWIPFPPTLVMHYDAGHFDTLTTMQEFEDFVYQNSTRHMERRRQVRRALRALDGQVVHWPYTHTEFIGSRKSLFGGPSYSAQKTQHFRHCVFQIKRHGELAWNRVQLGSGFEVVLTYSDAVQVDGTVIGLDEDFDLTPSLARFLMLNNALMQGRLHAIDTALYTYRKHFTREMKHKEKVLSYRFLSRVYNSPDDPARIAENALEIEQDLRVRTVLLSHEDAFNAAHERMSLVCSTPVRTWWYIFWDDFWRRNNETIPPLKLYESDFNPHYPTSIAYRPLPRRALESFLVQRGLHSSKPSRNDFVHNGLINLIMFRLNQIVYHGSRYEIMLHYGGKPLELTMEEVDWQIHQRGTTQGTGGGTDHDDSSIRPRHAFTWERIWDDPVSPGRWKRSSWRGKLSVWLGLRPHWTTSTTNGLALDVRLENGKYVILPRDYGDGGGKKRKSYDL